VDWWTLTHKQGIRLSWNPAELDLLRMWKSEFIPEGTTPLSAPAKVRDALWGAPTKIEQWRERAAELGVELAKPAAWPDRSKGYTSLPKPTIGGTAWVRMRTVLAGPIGTAKIDDIVKVSGDEAAALVEGGYAVESSQKEANERMRQFSTPGKIITLAGKQEASSEAQSLADPKGDAPVKELLAVGAQRKNRPARDEDWTDVDDVTHNS
jgi:hypothetical protein